MRVNGQRHDSAALPPGKTAVTHCIWGWVGSRTCLDECGKPRPPPGFDPRTEEPVANRYGHWLSTFILPGWIFTFYPLVGQKSVLFEQKKIKLWNNRNFVRNETYISCCLGDRGSTVVKVLCYRSEGRWFDLRWCQWIFHWHKILPIAL